MKEFLTSTEFWTPLTCITLLFFLSTRLYSLRNMPLAKLSSEFNIAFVFGKLVYQSDMVLIIFYIIINFLNGDYLKPIAVIALSFVLFKALLSNKKLGPSTTIPLPVMTFNCILTTLVFIIFAVFTYKLKW